jgi:hypothetical protein
MKTKCPLVGSGAVCHLPGVGSTATPPSEVVEAPLELPPLLDPFPPELPPLLEPPPPPVPLPLL